MKQLKLVLVFLSIGGLLASCLKNDGPVYDPQAQVEKEVPMIKTYVDSLNDARDIHLVKDDELFIWYEYDELNSGEDLYDYVDENKQLRWPEIRVSYRGELMDGTVFDEDDESDYMELRRLVSSWHVAFFPTDQGGLLEKGLQEGDKIRFIMPSYWGYGPNAQQGVPANSPLYFEIEVLEIIPPEGEGVQN